MKDQIIVGDSGDWGWAEISIAAVPLEDHSKVVEDIQNKWLGIENFTVLRLMISQVSALNFSELTAKVFVKRDLLTGLISRVQQKFPLISVTFIPVEKPVGTAEEANTIINLEWNKGK